MTDIEKSIPTNKAELRELNLRQAALIGNRATTETIDISDYSETAVDQNTVAAAEADEIPLIAQVSQDLRWRSLDDRYS